MDTPADRPIDDTSRGGGDSKGEQTPAESAPLDSSAKSGPKKPYGSGAGRKPQPPSVSARHSPTGAGARSDTKTSRTSKETSSGEKPRTAGAPRVIRGEKASRDGINRGPAERHEVRRKGWGSVANRGVERALVDEEGIAQNPTVEPEEWEPEEWIDEGEVRNEATGAVERATGAQGQKRKTRRDLPPDLSPEDAAEGFEDLMPAAEAARAGQRLASATKCFEREQYIEAQKTLQPLVQKVPMVAPVRELLGLTFYRLGKWKKAIAELEAFVQLTGSTEQHPVLADCYRALGRHRDVDRLWEELRAASPSAALVTEGRIVMAGMMADRGKVLDAIKLLEKDFTPPKKPQEHQLRRMYVLADLYDRSGEIQRASRLFGAINSSAPGFADVADRIRALS